MTLDRAAILIVEDEPIIGLALAFAIRRAGGEVVGPAASVKTATKLLETTAITAAIVDFNLPDGTAVLVIESLTARGVPVIVQTGVGIASDMAARFPDLCVRIKPVFAEELVAELETLMRNGFCQGKLPPLVANC